MIVDHCIPYQGSNDPRSSVLSARGWARELMLASVLSPWKADGNLELFDWIRQGGADTVTATVRELTGADAQPVEDWLDESRASFLVPTPGLPESVF